jgi:erythromycin esterase
MALPEKKKFSVFFLLFNRIWCIKHILFLVLCSLIFFAVTCTPEKSAPTAPDQNNPISPDEKTWLQNNAIALDTTEFTGNYTDLLPLTDMIGDARIVALTMSNYGTHEFFTISQRIVEFLIREKNFNIFALQANFTECDYINDYILTGKGILKLLIRGLWLWTWDTEEMTNIVKWMQIQNAGQPNEPIIYFGGFDILYPYGAINNVINYLSEVDSANAVLAASTYIYFRIHYFHYPFIKNYLRQFCRQYVVAMYDTLKNNQEEYVNLSSPEEYAFALQNAYFILQTEEVSRSKDPTLRFSYMVENIEYLLNRYGPDSKIILFSHSGYLGNFAGNLGSQLKSKYGDQFKIIGFSFYDGKFNSASEDPEIFSVGNPCIHEAEPPPADSYEAYFHEAGSSVFMLNLKYPGNPPGSEWLDDTRLMRFIGYNYVVSNPGSLFYPVNVREIYDIVFHIQSVNATKLLTIMP